MSNQHCKSRSVIGSGVDQSRVNRYTSKCGARRLLSYPDLARPSTPDIQNCYIFDSILLMRLCIHGHNHQSNKQVYRLVWDWPISDSDTEYTSVLRKAPSDSDIDLKIRIN